jgi:serine/threonine protein kinase
MIGKILSSRYKITQTLGSGGFGQTFLAEDTQIPGNPVCVVKQLKPLSNSPEQLAKAKELFKQEAEKLVQLGRHDQIPELLASFQDGNDLFLIQQYIEGQTLDAELKPGQIWPEQKVIQFLLDLLPVLDFIHKAGTIHRDIKPPNIIRRNRDNKPVLIDFGAVKEVHAQVGSTVQPTVATGTVIGTRGYMSSEQGQGKPRPSSDLYALGIICLQALTGKMPNQLDDDVDTGELVWKHLAQASPGLKQVMEKLTRYHFRDRYQSAAEALQAVQAISGNPQFSRDYQQTEQATSYSPNGGYQQTEQATNYVYPSGNFSGSNSTPFRPEVEPMNPPTYTEVVAPPDRSNKESFEQKKSNLALRNIFLVIVVGMLPVFLIYQSIRGGSQPASSTTSIIISENDPNCNFIHSSSPQTRPKTKLRKEPNSKEDENLIGTFPDKTKVMYIGQEQSIYMQVKLEDGTVGWIPNSEMYACNQPVPLPQKPILSPPTAEPSPSNTNSSISPQEPSNTNTAPIQI